MNKKLLMVAMGAALAAAPMLTVQAAPTVYGHFHMSFDNVDNDNAQYGFVASNSTRIGFKGDEDLGGGLKAIYQAESGALAADTGVGGFGGQLRNTYLGFAGDWGALKVGRHDTPFKDLGRKLDNFNEEVGDMRNILSGSSTVASLYDARVSNMIRYESPSMGGLSVNALHTSNTNTAGTTDTNTALTGNTNEGPTTGAGGGKALNSVGVNWSAGPIFVGGAWQKASFSKGGAVTKEHDSAWRLVGAYNMDALMVGFIYQDLKDIYGADLEQKTMGVAASFKMANNTLKFHYLTADDLSGAACGSLCSSTGGKLWALGVDHVFSKTTKMYVDYSQAKNDSRQAAYSVMSSNGGHGENLLPVTTGKKVKGISAGMVLNF